ncbi:MAG: DUF3079 domain-containing protein [Comamonadaceae bacterium]|nr:MAG: DUF3079 domain-containing protein [Comamonadaceae bacterium]
MATKKFPHHPPHPERNCWGCDKYCAAGSLLCGNGSERTQHPVELFGDDWAEWGAHKSTALQDEDEDKALAAAGSALG